ncbi:MAG TPA: hypothetical protein VFH93_07925 [Thermoleophilia bacterium]|nr:hypothetical protein [Thermoleophilia bacterium]
MRSGSDLVLLLTLGGGLFFTVVSVVAWTSGRRIGSLLIAVVAGVDFAFAVALLTGASGS